MPTKQRSIHKTVASSLVPVFLGLSIVMTGCSSVSDETKSQGKDVICAAGGGLAAQIRTGGAVTKFAAAIVRDNSTGDIQKLAEKIASGQGDEKAADELAIYVENLCA